MRPGWLLGIAAAVRLHTAGTSSGVSEFLACLDAIPVFNLTNVQDCCELISASSVAAAHSVDPSLMVPEVVLACVERSTPKECVNGDAARRADEAALTAPVAAAPANRTASDAASAGALPGASPGAEPSDASAPARAVAPVRQPLPTTEELEAELGLPSSAVLAKELAEAQSETAKAASAGEPAPDALASDPRGGRLRFKGP